MHKVIKNKIGIWTSVADAADCYHRLFALGLHFSKGGKNEEYVAVGLLIGTRVYKIEFQWNEYWNV